MYTLFEKKKKPHTGNGNKVGNMRPMNTRPELRTVFLHLII